GTIVMLEKTPSPDIDAAIEFLEELRPDGPWNLSAITPDGPIASDSFFDQKMARIWIAKHARNANIHYTANYALQPTGRGGRVTKKDIQLIEFLHGDFDLDKLPAGHDLAKLSVPERKEAVVGNLQ